jgi:hypothetical protein
MITSDGESKNMHAQINQFLIWQKKDLLTNQIEDISVSTDWYRGGRKIGKLRREYKQIETTDSQTEDFFAERIAVAHQTYMDRLAIHKLKGPTNQQAIKDMEINRVAKQSHLINDAISQMEKIVSRLQQTIATCSEQEKAEVDIESISLIIKQIHTEVHNKKNRLQVNNALLETLNSSNSFVGCSANIKTVPA